MKFLKNTYGLMIGFFLAAGFAFGATYFDDVITATMGVGSSPHSSNVFDVVSVVQSSRPCPVMTEIQRDAISSPQLGACVVNSNTSRMNFFDGINWVEFGSGFSSDIEINNQSGADITMTLPTESVVRLNNAALDSIGGIAQGSVGTVIILQNDTGGEVVVKDELGTETAVNRILTGTGQDLTMKPDSSIWLLYSDIDRWVVVGGSGISSLADVGDVSFTSLTSGDLLSWNGSNWTNITNNYVVGPASALDNTIARYDWTTGKLIQGSGVVVDDNDNLSTTSNVYADGTFSSTDFIRGDNSNFSTSIGNWSIYNDSAAAPVDCTGATPSANFYFQRYTTLPLVGKASGFIISTISNNQGNGISLPVSIPEVYAGRPLQLEFDYSGQTSYVNGDFKVYVYDVTNSVLLNGGNPYDITPLNAGYGKFSSIVYSGSTTTSLRVCIHNTVTGTTTKDLLIDEVKLKLADTVSVPITQEQVINLSGSGNFTGGSIRVARAGSVVSISILSAITYSSASSASSASGLIPEWARPLITVSNGMTFNGPYLMEMRIAANGILSVQTYTNAGGTQNVTSTPIGSISYTVDSQNTIQGLAVNANPPVLNVSKTGGSTSGMSAIASWSAPTKNIGFAFNTTTGLATIPEDGDYHFGVDGTWAASEQVAYNPIVNGTPLVRYTSQATNPSGALHNSGYLLLTNLKKGDTVGVGTTTGSVLSLDRITFTLEYKPSSNTAIHTGPIFLEEIALTSSQANAPVTARVFQSGKFIRMLLSGTLTGGISGDIVLTIPTRYLPKSTRVRSLGNVTFYDVGGQVYDASAILTASGTNISLWSKNAATANVYYQSSTASVPFAWVSGDQIEGVVEWEGN